MFTKEAQFTIRIQWLEDEDPDISYLGTFTSNSSVAGAIAYSTDSRKHSHFVPAITEQEHFESLREIVNPSSRSKQVYGVRTARKLAQQYVQEDMQRAASFGDSWIMLYCAVSIHLNGRVVGYASLHGIESDSDKSELQQVESEVSEEAYADAQAFLNTLPSVTLPALSEIEAE